MFTLGVGMSSSARPADVREAVGAVMSEAGLVWEDVSLVGTARHLADDARLRCLVARVVGFDPGELRAVSVPSVPSPVLMGLSAPPVAEAAALLAAGPGSRIVVPRRTGRYVTVAAAVGFRL
jgi:cobalamin biosynthesis protein CbiG